MSSIIGGLLGKVLGGGVKQKASVTQRSNISRNTPAEPAPKAKAAAKLALVKSGKGGVLNEATTGRRKLLGN